ncbi:MAG: SDR family NAD(P)-dependent oxidoreductase [Acidobacteria bacterium]|nr:SDR family NAD(P)-dependent oxidoreductase [Acidobacteriota bacterium]MBV9477003.1 SDR family NAD(P)-dependent oxidoreductase [Acidobacteriota bacterium]
MSDGYVLITGGCGFIGTNLADRLLRDGHRVCVFDNLSRAGVERNLEWLRAQHGERLLARVADTRDANAVREAVRGATRVFHLAAQVAVTTSLDDPVSDFENNARASLNVLEAIRNSNHRPPLLFTSTNKVYGGLSDVTLDEEALRYTPRNVRVAKHGVGETRPLDFHSPYGCSKGTADQYVRDYTRSYGLQTIVFRMSCIYGPHQFGTEDQGWVAHFLIRAINREPIAIYGDGKQVRDILFVDDLVDAMLLASADMNRCAGEAFNIGGGATNTISLRELLAMIRELEGREPRVTWSDWRTGDQKYYVSDARRFSARTGWSPRVGTREGVRRLREWLLTAGIPAMVQHAEEPASIAAKRVAGGGRVGERPVAAAAQAKE